MKPELVEVAGNLAYDSAIGRVIDNDPGLRIPTTNHRPAERLLCLEHGTSLAAPKVAHLAARILERYPTASANLLRALLVQSAGPPEGVQGWDPKTVLRLCGFGVPDIDRAIFSRPQRVTLYYEGVIESDQVNLFQVPVPRELAASKGRKAITVTIAYDPPVSAMNRDRPAGIQLTWGLARGDVAERTVEAAISTEAEEELADAGAPGARRKSVFLKGNEPKQPQRRGTVQKNVFPWVRGEYGETYRLAVTAKAVRPAHVGQRQRFAVVVTLECADASVNVYNFVRARLAAGRVRVRVRAE